MNEQTDQDAMNNFSSACPKVSFKTNSIFLGLVVLEEKLVTRTWTRTRTPQSHANMTATSSADIIKNGDHI